MLEDALSLATKNLLQRRMRSWLTLLGIFIGIAAIVSLISLGNGLRDAILGQISFIGGDMVIVSPGGLAGPPGSESGSAKLYERDLRAVDQLSDSGLVAGFLTRALRVSFGDEEKSILVFGLPTDSSREIFAQLSAFQVEQGRDIRDGELTKAIIGWGLASGDTFEKPVVLGKTINIQGKEFEVIGVRPKVGNPIFDRQVIISLDAIRDLTGVQEEISGIRTRPVAGVSAEELSQSVSRRLRRLRDVDEGNEDFRVQTSQQLLDTIGTVLLIVQSVVIGIAAISIVVGGIGIMNTMYTSVLERTKQIGVMKAIGARNKDILSIFVFESGLLGLVGGIVGVLLGVGLGKTVQYIGALALGSDLIVSTVSPGLILGALLFAFIVGTVAGILPAIQASQSNPVDALRYE